MTRNEARDYVRGHIKEYLEEKGIDTRKNFRCLSQRHEDQNPSMALDPSRNKVHCFSCGADLDTFDLIALDFKLTDWKEIFSTGYRIFGVDVEGLRPSTSEKPVIPAITDPSPPRPPEKKAGSNFDLEALRRNLDSTDYLAKRGISADLARSFGIGYSPKGQTPWIDAAAIVIPTGEGSAVLRNVDPLADPADRYRKIGPVQVFNYDAVLYSSEPVYVVEGEIDALSVIEAGFPAVALGSIANMGKFLDLCRTEPPSAPLVILLDADRRGEEAAEILSDELSSLGVAHYGTQDGVFLLEGYLDPNEFLVADKGAFEAFLDGISQEALPHEPELDPEPLILL